MFNRRKKKIEELESKIKVLESQFSNLIIDHHKLKWSVKELIFKSKNTPKFKVGDNTDHGVIKRVYCHYSLALFIKKFKKTPSLIDQDDDCFEYCYKVKSLDGERLTTIKPESELRRAPSSPFNNSNEVDIELYNKKSVCFPHTETNMLKKDFNCNESGCTAYKYFDASSPSLSSINCLMKNCNFFNK